MRSRLEGRTFEETSKFERINRSGRGKDAYIVFVQKAMTVQFGWDGLSESYQDAGLKFLTDFTKEGLAHLSTESSLDGAISRKGRSCP